MVDDEEKIRALYRRLLHDEGYVVMTAGSGEDAVSLLEREKVDLVLLDIRMPGIGGTGFYESIRENDSRPKVIVTSVNRIEEQRKAVAGACDYHEKAEGTEPLLAKVKHALGEREGVD